MQRSLPGSFEVKGGQGPTLRGHLRQVPDVFGLSMSYQFGADSRAARVSGNAQAKALPGQITWQLGGASN